MSEWLSIVGYWMEHHPGAAAWAQAIGATLAVVAAVLVPASQARHARQQREADRLLRAKSLAIAVYPELLHMRIAHRGIRRRLRERITLKQREGDRSGVEVAGADLAAEGKRLLIPITDTLRAMVPNFYLLGEPIGPQVQRCIGRAMKYNDLMNTLFGLTAVDNLPWLLAFIENGLDQVDTCIAGIEQAWQVSADEAHEFVDHITDQVGPVPMVESGNRSKETV